MTGGRPKAGDGWREEGGGRERRERVREVLGTAASSKFQWREREPANTFEQSQADDLDCTI
jgi:hypothetical protein